MKMIETRRCALGIFVLLCMLTLLPCYTGDEADKQQQLGKWVMTYYQHPAPEQFVEKVKEMAAAGLLHNSKPNARPDANVMFLGKIMAANADQISDWMDALTSLPAADTTALKRAVWYSGTAEGGAWLRANGEADLANGPEPMMLSARPAMKWQPHHLDQLWEWFFATGEEKPVAKIISLFSLAHELPVDNSLKLLSPPRKSDNKTQYQIQLYNYRLLRPAMWSTTSLAMQHDRVLEILKHAREKHEHARIKAWLGQIIKIAETERAKQSKNQAKSGGDSTNTDR